MQRTDDRTATTSGADTDFTVSGRVAILRSNRDWSQRANERILLYVWVAGAIAGVLAAGWSALPWALLAALVLFAFSRIHAVVEVIDRAEFDADAREVRIFRKSAVKRAQEAHPFDTIASIGVVRANSDEDRGNYKLAMLMTDDGRNIDLATGFRFLDEWNAIASRICELTGITRTDRLSGPGH